MRISFGTSAAQKPSTRPRRCHHNRTAAPPFSPFCRTHTLWTGTAGQGYAMRVCDCKNQAKYNNMGELTRSSSVVRAMCGDDGCRSVYSIMCSVVFGLDQNCERDCACYPHIQRCPPAAAAGLSQTQPLQAQTAHASTNDSRSQHQHTPHTHPPTMAEYGRKAGEQRGLCHHSVHTVQKICISNCYVLIPHI